MELVFNPCGEFRWSLEGPVSQIHSPHLQVGDPGIFSDLSRSVKMVKRGWGAESNGKLPHLFIPDKTGALVPEFAVEVLPSAELQPWFLRFQWRTYPWVEHSDMYIYIYIYIRMFLCLFVCPVCFPIPLNRLWWNFGEVLTFSSKDDEQYHRSYNFKWKI